MVVQASLFHITIACCHSSACYHFHTFVVFHLLSSLALSDVFLLLMKFIAPILNFITHVQI
jgi:hypothetical protein